MSVTQDWPSVWPVARTFHPASVPLPLHQGYVPANKPVPNKWGNLELMKIPNFLHLTPPAIQRHCEALKSKCSISDGFSIDPTTLLMMVLDFVEFCTPWPANLQNPKEVDDHFPLTIVSSDYCHSTPSIRDHRARIITLQVGIRTNFSQQPYSNLYIDLT